MVMFCLFVLSVSSRAAMEYDEDQDENEEEEQLCRELEEK